MWPAGWNTPRRFVMTRNACAGCGIPARRIAAAGSGCSATLTACRSPMMPALGWRGSSAWSPPAARPSRGAASSRRQPGSAKATWRNFRLGSHGPRQAASKPGPRTAAAPPCPWRARSDSWPRAITVTCRQCASSSTWITTCRGAGREDLNRRSVPSWARGSARRSAAEPGGSDRSSGGGLFLEQDLLAGEAFEFGDELALAAQRREPVVPVGAEVGELGVWVGQQVPGDDQDGVADRDQGSLFAAAAGEPVVAGGQEGLGAGG